MLNNYCPKLTPTKTEINYTLTSSVGSYRLIIYVFIRWIWCFPEIFQSKHLETSQFRSFNRESMYGNVSLHFVHTIWYRVYHIVYQKKADQIKSLHRWLYISSHYGFSDVWWYIDMRQRGLGNIFVYKASIFKCFFLLILKLFKSNHVNITICSSHIDLVSYFIRVDSICLFWKHRVSHSQSI